jgi:hypothetical protein
MTTNTRSGVAVPVNKCETYINDHGARIYLEPRIKGLFERSCHREALLRSAGSPRRTETYEREAEVEDSVRDGSFEQKSGEIIMMWKQRCIRV